MNPRVALLVISDGRGLKRQAVESFHANARKVEIACVVEVDDAAHELGFCGAIREGWRQVRAAAEAFDYVFHLEEDFTFDRPFDVAAMTSLLERHTWLAQVSLRRGAHGSEPAGGYLEAWPDDFTDQLHPPDPPLVAQQLWPWLEHALWWTTNPSLYPRSLVYDFEWPEAPACEHEFGSTLIAEGMAFAVWGARDSEPWVHHVGERTGGGY